MTKKNTVSNIERIVMRRIHTIRILRILLSNTSLALGVFAVAVWGIGREVLIDHVLQNAPHNLMELPQFYLAAFDHTRFSVQVLTLVILATLITLARETARTISSIFIPARV